MKKREDKQKDVEALHEMLQSTPTVFVTGFEKLTVAQDFELRKAVRGAGGTYKVVKNTVAENASKGTPSQDVLRGLAGMTSLAYTRSDPVALVKTLTAYAKENPTFTFKAGIVEGRVINTSEIRRLAELPSRNELFARLLFLIQAPAANLARVINGVGRNLAVVISEACKQNKGFSSN